MTTRLYLYKFTVLALLYYFQLILTNTRIIYTIFCIHNCKTHVKLMHYFTFYFVTNLCTIAPLLTS